MASLFSETWLLICAVVAVQLAVARSQFCSTGWKFHNLTGTCMKLEKMEYRYLDAKNHCEKTNGGHLVFIFDEATDKFVKGLLDKDVDRALIGLQDRTRNGEYFWGPNDKVPVSYTGWADNPHRSDSGKRAVIITKDGWKDYDKDDGAYFVCQVNVDFPVPKILCPSAEEGQSSPYITCTIDSRGSYTVTDIRFQKNTTLAAWCDADSCTPSQDNQGHIVVSRSQTTGSTSLWNLRVINVRRSHEDAWTCSVKYSNSGAWVTSSPCSLKVYAKPTGVECSHRFVQSTVEASCKVARVYPQLVCSWKVMYKSQETAVQVTTPDNVWFASSNTYYRATCQANFKVIDPGRYEITVSMFPTLPDLNTVQKIDTARVLTVSVEPPKGSPKFYIDEKALKTPWLEVTENVTLRLTCRVPGGDPPVYRTIITCGQLPQKYESDGSWVTMDVGITRNFHRQTCICSALHAAHYAQTVSVEIRVKYPATVASFSISSRYSTISPIRAGDSITFTCVAKGNPTPYLAIQRQDGTTFINVSSDNTITHTQKAKCNDSGKYLCLANNTVNSQHYLDSKVAHLQVRCAAEHYDGISSLDLPAAVSFPAANASLKIRVRVYPAPTSFALFKGNNTDQRLKESKYQASFSFTNEEDGVGDITVTIFGFTQEDTGDYTLYSEYKKRTVELYSYLRFRAFAQGPPSCPSNFTVVKADPDSVTLSWTPGFDGGLRQTFTVFRVDVSGDTASSLPSLTMLGDVEDPEKDPIFEATGLSESTMYTFSLEVTNEKGSGNCSHLLISVSTSASLAALVDNNAVTVIVVPVIVVVVLAILVIVLVVVVIRRRKGSLQTKPVKSADNVVSGSPETNRAGINNSDGDVLYANAATKDVKKENKREKPPRKTVKETDQNPVYAVINPQNKKGKKKRNNDNMHKDVSDVYQNVPKPNMVQTSFAADGDNVYANAKLPNIGKSTPKKTSSRTVNQEGLVYVAVEINKSTTYPEIVPAKKPTGKKPQPEQENVEYIAINFAPAAKLD